MTDLDMIINLLDKQLELTNLRISNKITALRQEHDSYRDIRIECTRSMCELEELRGQLIEDHIDILKQISLALGEKL